MFTLSPLTLMLAIASAGTTGLPNNTIKAAPAPHENISAIEPPGIIPVWRVGCFEHPKLNADDVNIAKQKLDTWGILNKIPGRTWRADLSSGAAMWICNCKIAYNDPVLRPELDEAQARIYAECGEAMSGWVWSKQWKKVFVIGPVHYLYPPPVNKDWCVVSGCARHHKDKGCVVQRAYYPKHPIGSPRSIDDDDDDDDGHGHDAGLSKRISRCVGGGQNHHGN